jgi:adenylate kinase family enzyme
MKPQSYIFIGRAGAGKGTQAKLLSDVLKKIHDRPILYVETGIEFRKFISTDNHTARLGKDIIETGGLMPEFMPVFIWGKILTEQYKGDQHLIFDGTPRKLLEAQLLDSVFPFYSLGKPHVIYLDIEHEESHTRLMIRSKEGRKDDNAEAIEHRRIAFEQDVLPTVEWYRTNPHVTFLDTDGHGTVLSKHWG